MLFRSDAVNSLPSFNVDLGCSGSGLDVKAFYSGVEQLVAYLAHNQKVVGSSPASATRLIENLILISPSTLPNCFEFLRFLPQGFGGEWFTPTYSKEAIGLTQPSVKRGEIPKSYFSSGLFRSLFFIYF